MLKFTHQTQGELRKGGGGLWWAGFLSWLLLTSILGRGVEWVTPIWQGSEAGEWAANVGVDAGGNSYLMVTQGRSVVVSRRNPVGEVGWRKTYTLPVDTHPQFLTVTPGGESWIVNWKANSATGLAGTREIVKYSATGERLFVVNPETLISKPFLATAAVADSKGNLYLGGTRTESQPLGGGEQIVVLKLAPDGSESFFAQSPVPSGRQTVLQSIHVALDGSLTALAYGFGSGAVSPWTLVRWGGSGTFEWLAEVTWASTGAFAKAMQVDAAGAVYVGGGGMIQGSFRPHLAKIAADGSPVWNTSETSSTGGTMFVSDLKVLPSGDFLVIAQEETKDANSVTRTTWVLKRYTAEGVEQWVARYPGTMLGEAKVIGGGRIAMLSREFLVNGAARDGLVVFGPEGDRVVEWVGQAGLLNRFEVDSGGDLIVQSASVANVPEIRKLRIGATEELARARVEPGKLEVLAGDRAELRARVSSAESLRYQWLHFGQPLPGATNESLVLEPILMGARGGYSVQVTGTLGTSTSTEAWLEVRLRPTFLGSSQTNRLPEGRSYRIMDRRVIGDPPLSFQWQHRGEDIPGETNELFGIHSVTPEHAGEYRLKVTNPYGVAWSDPYGLQVVPWSPLDGWEWRNPRPQGNDLLSISHGNGRYVAVGIGGTLMLSSDGVHWENQPADSNGSLMEVRFAEGRFVAVGRPGRVLSSVDGTVWVPAKVPITENMVGVVQGGGRWVMLSERGLYVSTNGLEWAASPWKPPGAPLDITHGNGRFVLLVSDQNAPVLTSIDAVSWTPVAFNGYAPGADRLKRVDFGAGRFVMVSREMSWVSTNGVEWVAADPVGGRLLEDVAVGDSMIVAAGTEGEGSDADRTRLFSSIDGLRWVTNAVSPGNNLHRVAWVGGRFFGLGDDGAFVTSTEGRNWAVISKSGDRNWQSVAMGGGWLLAVGQQGTAIRSRDAQVWEVVETGMTNELVSVCHGDGRFVVVGRSGEFRVTEDGEHWKGGRVEGLEVLQVSRGGGKFLISGYGKALFASTQGEAWTAVPFLDSFAPRVLAYGDGRWVGLVGGGEVMVSTNGLEWEKDRIGGVNFLNTLAYGNGRFVALAADSSGNPAIQGIQVMISEDGQLWRLGSSGMRLRSQVLWFEEGRFLMQSASGALMSSVDAQEWVEHFIPLGSGVNGMATTPWGSVIAVGNNRAILESHPMKPWLGATREPGGLFGLELRGWPGKGYKIQTTGSLEPARWEDVAEGILEGTREKVSGFFIGGGQYFRLVAP